MRSTTNSEIQQLPAIKWTTKSTWVDIDTGEIIDKTKIKEYDKIKSNRETTVRGNCGTVSYTTEARKKRARQLDLFDDL